MLSAFKIKPERIGPIVIRERKRLLRGQGNFEEITEIFGLSSDKPIIKKPIERGERIYVVRFIEQKETKSKDGLFWPASNFFRTWMAKLTEKAKVVSFLEE